jgi:GT2 family glycosyltransferase
LSPACSVIVLNWNGRQHLQACLESLRLQSYRDSEVILVDNGSADGSAAFVRDRFSWVRLIELPRNVGFCGGNNAGIKAATGKYIALLNNDTEADPHWLAELVAAAEAAPDAGSCASQMLLYDRRDLLDSAGNECAANGVAAKRGHLQRASDHVTPRDVFGACAGAALYTRALFEKVGMLDEKFFMIFEDADLGFRAQLAGYRCIYVPTARVYHKVNSSIGTYSRNYVYFGHRNLEIVYLKNMPARLLIRSLPAHLLYDLMAFVFFSLRGRGGAFLKAKLDVIRWLPETLKARRSIQSRRRIPDQQLWRMLERSWLRQRWAEKAPRGLRNLAGAGHSSLPFI